MHKNHLKYIYTFVLFPLFLFPSCNKNEVYYKFAEINEGEWKQRDTLFFEIDSNLFQPAIPYIINVEISHNSSYPYRNVWLYFEDNINDSIPMIYSKEFLLADNFGKWYGAGFGSLYQLSFTYKDSVLFAKKQNYQIKIIHGMRDEPLKGIEKVGIKIENLQQ